MKNFKVLLVLIGILLTSCQSLQPLDIDPTLDLTNSGTIYVYRPKSDWNSSSVDLNVFINDQFLATLQRGRPLSVKLVPGEYTLTVRPFFMGIPDGKPYNQKVDVSIGSSHFYRFEQSGSVTLFIGTPVITGNVSFAEVNESTFSSLE